MKLQWDYTALAKSYDDRANYDSELIRQVINLHETESEDVILDLGAGTGKLTRELINSGLRVIASEPNDAMREIGIQNIKSEKCIWISSQAENVDVKSKSISSTWFGSSFNVIRYKEAFNEFARYSKPSGWLTCLWNHRDLSDSIQSSVEEIFLKEIPSYSYGIRRQDPTERILESGLFGSVEKFSSNFEVTMKKSAYVEAWKSHGTLLRQARDVEHFLYIIRQIDMRLGEIENLTIPYTTRLWTAKSTLV
jgi:ubiquinone/menaquinone biosynthesis C-methylase UbiE